MRAVRAILRRAACHSESMRFRYHRPDPRLRELVQGYWELEDMQLERPEQNFDVPERTLRLMFSAETVLIGPTADTLRPVAPVVLTPFTLQPQSNVVRGKLRVLVADLYPWGARQLLGWSVEADPDALNEAVSASAWGREVLALVDLGEWRAAREALEAHLLRLAGLHEEPGAGVQAAHHIYESFGTVRVADLAETLNVSARTLERQFARQVGVSAKTLARVVRFDEVNTRIRTDPAVPMAELTYQLGFFDQAHLIREFKALSSMTPTAFATIAARRREAMTFDLDLVQDSHDQDFEVHLQPDFEAEPA